MSEPRKQNYYGNGILVVIYLVGVLSASPSGSSWNWAQAWRAVLWPYYITWVEVGRYIEKAAAPPTATP